MHVELSILNPEEILLGVRVSQFKLCEGIDDETKKMMVDDHISFSIGLLFIMLSFTFLRQRNLEQIESVEKFFDK